MNRCRKALGRKKGKNKRETLLPAQGVKLTALREMGKDNRKLSEKREA